MITMMRTQAITKASRHKVVLSWTKTIWAMVRSMREMRQSTWRSARWSVRIRARQKIKELITIWVSIILKLPLLNSLATEAKLIQVTSMATKHANESFFSRLGDFFLHISLGVEGWLWTG
jgi:ribosomal protein L20